MIALGLSAADLALFNRSLCTHHSVKVTVQVLDLNHNYKADVSTKLLDGQVNVDGNADTTRSLTMQLLDPDRVIQLDSNSPGDGALFFDRMIRIVYSVKSELLPRWVDVPIFCGPITKLSRTHEVINVEAMGKEHLSQPPTLAYFSRTYAKNTKRTSLLRHLMATYAGETKFTIPDWAMTTAAPVVMTAETNMWALAKAVRGSGNQLFYDGRGVLVLRKVPTKSIFTFRTTTGGGVLSWPVIDFDIADVRNHVRVKGAIPTGKQTPVMATASLPTSHPLHSLRLGRNGKHRIIMEVVSDENLKTAAQCLARARSEVNTRAMQSVDVRFDAVVVPHLEPEDVYTLQTPDFALTNRVKQFSIPLRSARMSMGTLSKRSTNKTRIRR